MRFLFRTDASPQIGTGHVMRCASLANILRQRGAETCFVSLDLPPHLQLILEAEGHMVRRLPESVRGNEIEDAKAAIGGENFLTACIVDHYRLGREWEACVMPHADVLAIDDIGRPHVARWLLDQNYYERPERRYDDQTPVSVQRLLGPRYALLRGEFAEARPFVKIRNGDIRSILVFLGGMDVDNVTSTALNAIDKALNADVNVDVIAGPSHPYLSQLNNWCTKRGRASLSVQVSDMSRHLLNADLAIGAGGSNTLERCACALPTVAICIAENQREVIQEGTRAGFLWGVNHIPEADEIANILKLLVTAPDLVQHMSRQAFGVTDARGAYRVADLLMPRAVQMRPATLNDARKIYRWRTAPQILEVSRIKSPFSFALHYSWLEKAIDDPNRLLLIGTSQGDDVGVVRFDIDGTRAEVSIFLAPEVAGAGLGTSLLAAAEIQLKHKYPHVMWLDAWVEENNLRSLRMFERSGYSMSISRLEKELS